MEAHTCNDTFSLLAKYAGRLLAGLVNLLFDGSFTSAATVTVGRTASSATLSWDDFWPDTLFFVDEGEMSKVYSAGCAGKSAVLKVFQYPDSEPYRVPSHDPDGSVRIDRTFPETALLDVRPQGAPELSGFVQVIGNVSSVTHKVQSVVAVRDYSLDQLIEANALFLAPFSLLSQMQALERDGQPEAPDALLGGMRELVERLDQLMGDGSLSRYEERAMKLALSDLASPALWKGHQGEVEVSGILRMKPDGPPDTEVFLLRDMSMAASYLLEMRRFHHKDANAVERAMAAEYHVTRDQARADIAALDTLQRCCLVQ